MIVALDLETSWLDPLNNSIIEFALVKFDENTFEIKDKYTTLVNPWINIPDLISNITNITNKDLESAPKWYQVVNKVNDFIWDLPILWHNVYFDKDFLFNNWVDLSNNITIDTFLFANSLCLKAKSLNLEYVLSFFWKELNWSHRALADTLWAISLFQSLLDQLKSFDKIKKELYISVCSRSEDSWFLYILDTFLSSNILKKNKSLNKILLDLIEEKEDKSVKKKIDNDIDNNDIKKYLSNIEWLEIRNNQLDMLDYVNSIFLKGWRTCIEAPTWLWKTFAYLIPSIIYSVKNWEQVYISTTTKLLQDQIFFKDLNFLFDKLDIDFTFTKLKWKSNYFWIKTFIDFLKEDKHYSKEKTSFILKIYFWLFDTIHWELDEIDYYWQEFLFLKQINADTNLIFNSNNEYEDMEFAVRARRKSRQSNIVVINNNILFQDIEWDWNILWEVNNLILDEAHNLEDVVTNTLKKSFSLYDMEKLFSNLDKLTKNNLFDSYDAYKSDILFNFWLLFDLLWEYFYVGPNETLPNKSFLIKDDFYWENSDSIVVYEKLVSLLIDVLDRMSILDDSIFSLLSKDIKFIEDVLDILRNVFKNKKDIIALVNYNKTYWYSLWYTILNVWDYLENNLWLKLKTTVITSATLQIDNKFDYISWILKLNDFDFKVFDTDFDYKKQSLLFIPNDLWSIKNNISNILNFLREFIFIVRWNSLFLFTSFYIIKEVFLWLNNDLKNEWINVYAQSIMWWKYKLIDMFKKSPSNSILLWTDSFREWIDIPWDDLKYLVIHKIPFMVPSDPIFQARSKMFKDSFYDYSVPKSIIKLKQWFWRLIRKKWDTWIVIFLDDRIINTSWWKLFFHSFPSDVNTKIANSMKLLEILKN